MTMTVTIQAHQRRAQVTKLHKTDAGGFKSETTILTEGQTVAVNPHAQMALFVAELGTGEQPKTVFSTDLVDHADKVEADDDDNIPLGSYAKDTITGMTGIVTGKASYLTGCDQYVIQPNPSKDGDVKEGRWFDRDRLVILPQEPYRLPRKGKKDGGPAGNAPIK